MFSTVVRRTGRQCFAMKRSMSSFTYTAPVVDAHFHFFHPPSLDAIFEVEPFYREEYVKMVEGINVVASVHLQTTPTVEETQRVHDLAEEDTMLRPNGIVVGVDLELGAKETEEEIIKHMEVSPRVRGIRRSGSHQGGMSFSPVPKLYRHPKFLEGYSLLEPYGLSFDAWCYGDQIPDVTNLARSFPNTKIILNHFGTPTGIDAPNLLQTFQPPANEVSKSPECQERTFSKWKNDFEELSRCDNVHIKLSGLLMPMSLACRRLFDEDSSKLSVTQKIQDLEDTWDVEKIGNELLPYIAHGVSLFGVDRCVWASNFPVDGFGGISYRQNFAAYKHCLDLLNISEDDQRKIFHDNALEFYKINVQ